MSETQWHVFYRTTGMQETKQMLHVLLNQVALTLSHDTISPEDALELVASYIDGWPVRTLPHKRFVKGDWASWEDSDSADTVHTSGAASTDGDN